MFVAVSLTSIPPVLVVGYAAHIGSYPLMLAAAFFLGVAGTVFAIGIPFANNWFAPQRRGFATGVFGMGWSEPRCRRSSPRGWWRRSACSPPT